MELSQSYAERIYAGVLGKIIGVYLGRPFEGWSHERIRRELGDITWYVNDRLQQPLVVTDDDISGTFTFLRALADNGATRDLSARQIGETWLNYIVEGRSILWWGGMGESTEHTAYLRLKAGIEAPRSGSRAVNGKIVSEQIGAEIFIDGWAMVAPGDPELAVRLAGEAARVSHDGEAAHAAVVLAAMEAGAFVERDVQKLLSEALRFIPPDSETARMAEQVRGWHAREKDWQRTRALIEENHGYARYGGHVPAIPNFAVVLMAILYGESNFQKSLMVANTSGWDTDCNSGNVGCFLGIKEGLSLFDGQPDWRGPVADRMYLPTADGGRTITDAVSEAWRIAALGRALKEQAPLSPPKGGARFHFELPGAVQGFSVEDTAQRGNTAAIENVVGHSEQGTRSLAVHYSMIAPHGSVRVTTPTFIPPDALTMKGYAMLASPTLYPGQLITARIEADFGNSAPIAAKALLRLYGANDQPEDRTSPAVILAPGQAASITWETPNCGGSPIFSVGIELTSEAEGPGTAYLDFLTWNGTPRVVFKKPAGGGNVWRRAWVNAFDHFEGLWPDAFRVSQDRGTGLLITGCREWADYRATCTLATDMAAEYGLAARVQGLRRYYALVLTGEGKAEMRKELQGTLILGRVDFPWIEGSRYTLSIEARGTRLSGYIDGRRLFELSDDVDPLTEGAVALACTEGCVYAEEVHVEPLEEVRK